MDILALLVSFISSIILPFTTAPAPAPEPAPVAACQYEDGSGDQSFPCYWNGGENGLGEHYTLDGPVQPEPEPEPEYVPEPADDGGVTFDDGDGAIIIPAPGVLPSTPSDQLNPDGSQKTFCEWMKDRSDPEFWQQQCGV